MMVMAVGAVRTQAHGSLEVLFGLFDLAGTPVKRDQIDVSLDIFRVTLKRPLLLSDSLVDPALPFKLDTVTEMRLGTTVEGLDGAPEWVLQRRCGGHIRFVSAEVGIGFFGFVQLAVGQRQRVLRGAV